MYNAVCSNGHISPVGEERIVHEKYYETGAGVHDKGTQSDGDGLPYDAEIQFIDASAEVEQFILPAEEAELYDKGDGLGEDGRNGGSSDSPSKSEDEKGVEDGVRSDGEESAVHGSFGMSCTTKYCIETEIAVADDISPKNDEHVVASIG